MDSWLKIDFHIHTSEDPYDIVTYDIRRLILEASQKDFDVLVVTNHDLVTLDDSHVKYAKEHGLLLIPGMEANISTKHVLIINPDFTQNSRKSTFSDLKSFKRPDNLIIAPHPYFPGSSSLGSDFEKNIHLFDAIEYSQYYNRLIDFNKKAVQAAQKHGLPMIGSSDSHRIWQFGQAYSLVNAEKNTASIIQAVKKGRIRYHSPPLSAYDFFRSGFLFIQTRCFKALRRKRRY